MTKNRMIDLTKNNREHYMKNWYSSEKIESKPQVLLSMFINDEGKLEEIKVLDEFIGEEWGHSIKNNYDECFEFCDVPVECSEKNALYHVYASVSWEKTSYEYEEYDPSYTYHKIIKVMSNYSEFVNKNTEWEEQQKLKELDEGIEVVASGEVYNYIEDDEQFDRKSKLTSSITINDVIRFIKIIAEHDIKLAHRFASHWEVKKALNDKYDEEIAKIENKRKEFIKHIKFERRVKTHYDSRGYHISSNHYSLPKGEFTITFEEIDNISNELLEKYSSEELIEYFINTKSIIKTLKEENEDEDEKDFLFLT